jgi:hypothetical protein
MNMIKKTYKQIHDSKTGKVSDKWESYLGFYEELFKDHRDDRVSILEIGIQNGGSLETYAEYFKNFEILIGCDINENCKKLKYNQNKMAPRRLVWNTTFTIGASSRSMWFPTGRH